MVVTVKLLVKQEEHFLGDVVFYVLVRKVAMGLGQIILNIKLSL